MSSRVFAVARALPGDAGEYVLFRSDQSLFDADVIVFTPTLVEYSAYESYQGRPLLSESDSARVAGDCAHWHQEIKAAAEAGKVIFNMLAKPDVVYYDTGHRTYSGTGRSWVATRQVASVDSYGSLPFTIEGLVPRGGPPPLVRMSPPTTFSRFLVPRRGWRPIGLKYTVVGTVPVGHDDPNSSFPLEKVSADASRSAEEAARSRARPGGAGL